MDYLNVLSGTPLLFQVLVGVLGLVMGSFLNVVIYRLPIMLEQNWRQECREFLKLEAAPGHPAEAFNLALPRSHCPHCQRSLTALENIPLVSYLILGGRCRGCHATISSRYPLVEALTMLLSVIVAWRFGPSPQMLMALMLTWSLIALSFIDMDHHLLPDVIIYPVLWSGLGLSVFGLFTDSTSSIIGVITGYLTLWLIYHLFRLLTGREGMGYGDFKLLALLGAWLGWVHLPVILTLSSCAGAIYGLVMVLLTKKHYRSPVPYGPFLAAAGWLALVWGDDMGSAYLQFINPV